MAASAIAAPVAAILGSYLLDRFGATISPLPVLLFSLTCGASMLLWCLRAATRRDAGRADLATFAGVVLGVLVALLWLAWPELLPPGGGSDLTHHLQLIDFIDRQWRLAHTQADALLIGNMINYTPGSHLLAAVAGAWSRSDGLHAVYPVLAVSVAIKAGLVFLIVRRMLGDRGHTPIAVGAVLLLFLPYDYFIGSFARFSFVAQVVSETFAVAMWLALAVWNERPSGPAAVLFGVAGAGVFLTWPVWIGPPVLVLVALVLIARDPPLPARLRHVAYALGPIAVVGVLHALGRAESVAIVQSGGAAFWPTVARFGWPFLALAGLGVLLAVLERSGRVTILLLAATALQTLALLVVWRVARAEGADSPYMALKMPHFAIYPMAAAGALALSSAWRLLLRVVESAVPGARPKTGWAEGLAWVLVITCTAWTASSFASVPRPAPAITEDMYRAGRWARDHAQPDCIEYLVPQDSTSYWLHQAVLGNPMQPLPGSAPPVFVYREAVVRWITGTSFPVAIADLSVVPREVREDLEVLARFGHVAVGRRRGTTACPGH